METMEEQDAGDNGNVPSIHPHSHCLASIQNNNNQQKSNSHYYHCNTNCKRKEFKTNEWRI